jgi:hypothetical protein
MARPTILIGIGSGGLRSIEAAWKLSQEVVETERYRTDVLKEREGPYNRQGKLYFPCRLVLIWRGEKSMVTIRRNDIISM